jgi:hypothetical protein
VGACGCWVGMRCESCVFPRVEMPIDANRINMVCRSSYPRLCSCAPLHLCTSTPVHLTSTPPHPHPTQGMSVLAAWVGALGLRRGVLRAFDEGGEIEVALLDGAPVYIKYNSTSGDAYAKANPVDGFVGVIFQVYMLTLIPYSYTLILYYHTLLLSYSHTLIL